MKDLSTKVKRMFLLILILKNNYKIDQCTRNNFTIRKLAKCFRCQNSRKDSYMGIQMRKNILHRHKNEMNSLQLILMTYSKQKLINLSWITKNTANKASSETNIKAMTMINTRTFICIKSLKILPQRNELTNYIPKTTKNISTTNMMAFQIMHRSNSSAKDSLKTINC